MPITGADGRALAFSIRARGHVEPLFIEDKSVVLNQLADILEANDIVLMQGAGDISGLVHELAEKGLQHTDVQKTWRLDPV
jgi:UDP-N-acetylmuramate--alanine ligase